MAREKYKYIEVTPDTHRKIKAAAAAAGVPIRIFIENALFGNTAADSPEPQRRPDNKPA